ncbi:flagellar assembly protein FliW [Lysinibacillus sp. BW-2-10]|uniref:flagellar assembly protein FliW n=1 Tax=Lysinibacillus sp. BW-2-10 TaxID=2590030 RepID=UPI00117CF44A|nr:flagellar assembly protein FliW [Lysinibacillus sp. BW-2-10]TSI07327.1 flagellar assembly protein FliW [Lysinibacillus sp. BW-2-10]
MIIETDYLGEIEIDSTNIITFEHGIPGFEEEKEFIILTIEEQSAFQMLQSVQTKALAFVITDPGFIIENYIFDLDESTVHALEIKNEKEVSVYSIVSLKETIADSTINLKAPIVINTTNNKAKQVILDNEQYHIRHRIGTESKRGE